MVCTGSEKREGALSVLGAVSPPGGDLSDPVVQATLKVVQVFWSLEDQLAYRRHFPAINWLTSYSLYHDNLEDYMRERIAPDWVELRQEAMRLLQRESELEEIARLVGVDALADPDRLVLETARSIREDFLHQNAFHPIDTYTSLEKQSRMLRVILLLHRACVKALDEGQDFGALAELPVRQEIARAKLIKEDDQESFTRLEARIEAEVTSGETKAAAGEKEEEEKAGQKVPGEK